MTGVDATSCPRVVRKAVLRHDPVRDAEVLLLPERVVRLNATGAKILARCDGSRTLEQIVAELCDAFSIDDDVSRQQLEADVSAFLGAARSHGWIDL